MERKILANVVIGERVANKAVKKAQVRERPKQRASGGSDVAVERGRQRTPKTARERLEGIKF